MGGDVTVSTLGALTALVIAIVLILKSITCLWHAGRCIYWRFGWRCRCCADRERHDGRRKGHDSGCSSNHGGRCTGRGFN